MKKHNSLQVYCIIFFLCLLSGICYFSSSLLVADFQMLRDGKKQNKVNKYWWFISPVFACLLEMSAKIFSYEWWWISQCDETAYQTGYGPFVKVEHVQLTYLDIGIPLKACTAKVCCHRHEETWGPTEMYKYCNQELTLRQELEKGIQPDFQTLLLWDFNRKLYCLPVTFWSESDLWAVL